MYSWSLCAKKWQGYLLLMYSLSASKTVSFAEDISSFAYFYRWGVLNVVSGTGKSSYSDQTIMFAAGYLEGALTAK